MLNSLTPDNNIEVTNWISSGISPEKIKPFDPSLTLIIFSLGNGKVSIKFNNSVLVQQNSFSKILSTK